MIEVFIKGIVLIAILMLFSAYMTFLERVIIARMQQRIGPNRVGPFGLLQPIADGIKLLTKERFQPNNIETFIYWLAPAISLFTALFVFVLIPFGESIEVFGHTVTLYMADVNAGIVFLLAFSSLAVYGVVLSGWSSNNRYALLGSLRGTAQMISYEIPMGLSIVSVIISAQTLNLPEIVAAQKSHWFILTNPIAFIIYIITAFAETNRAPFDLPEAEQELTAGYHTEYGGLKFAMFFLAEYVNILAVSCIAITLFLGGWQGPFDIPFLWFFVKLFLLVFLFIWVRATMPRFRYNELMSFSWKVLTPLALVNLIVVAFLELI